VDICLANEIVPWEVEEIPDRDILFMRIPRVYFPDGILNTAAFHNIPKRDGGMSMDWNKYSTPRDTRRRSQQKPPEDYAIVSLEVGAVRAIPDQTVVHEPLPTNRAHTEVFGEKHPEARLQFGRLVDRFGYIYRVDDPDE
jgi:hypothetical protein